MVSKEVFQENFWWCHNRLQEAATDEVGMPGYFRFLVLLGEEPVGFKLLDAAAVTGDTRSCCYAQDLTLGHFQ